MVKTEKMKSLQRELRKNKICSRVATSRFKPVVSYINVYDVKLGSTDKRELMKVMVRILDWDRFSVVYVTKRGAKVDIVSVGKTTSIKKIVQKIKNLNKRYQV